MQHENKPKNIAGLWDEAYGATRDHVKEYHLNHAYLEGFQWFDWDPIELQVQALSDDADRIQATFNHMRANVRTLTSQLTQRELTFEVHPSAYDDATIRATKVGEALLADLAKDHDWEILREGHIKSVLKGGSSAVAVDWDPENMTTVETVLGIPEFVVEPGARAAETARWWIKLQLLPPKEVQSMFPDHFEMAPPEADGRLGMASEYEYRERDTKLTRVFTYYERPNPLNPEGCIKVEVNGKIVQKAEEWPFPWKHRLNFCLARESLIEHEAFGSTVLSDVRSPQTALNAAWSGFLEHMRESSNHRLVFDENWIDAIDSLNDRAGAPLVGPKMKSGAPDYLKAPPIPTGLIDGINMLKAEIDNLLGVHDVSRGQAPANIESGYGLSILAEKDASPVGRLIKETARVWSRVGWMVLELHQQEVKKERTTSVHDGHAPSVRKWKGKDIMGQTRALVPTEAIIPKSQAAQQQWAEHAVEMGLINPQNPMAIIQFARLADMPDQRGIINATLPDAAKAIRENEAVVMDEVPLPADFDDHAIHIEVHNDFRKSLQYDLLEDQQRIDIDNHIKAHETMAQQSIADQRLGTDIDPALGAAPRADGAAPIEALPPVPPEAMAEMPPEMEGMMPPEASPTPDPEGATAALMEAIQNL